MIVENITLLTFDEYEEYKSLIPQLKLDWWLRTPVNDNFVYYVFSNVIDSANTTFSFYVRPIIKISDHDLTSGDYFKFFGVNWIVLDKDIAISSVPIAQKTFDAYVSEWKTSDLKKWLKKWFLDKCQKSIFPISITNKIEFSLLKTLCNKFDIDFTYCDDDVDFLFSCSHTIFCIFNAPTKELKLNTAMGDLYEPKDFIMPFAQFCDYISENLNFS